MIEISQNISKTAIEELVEFLCSCFPNIWDILELAEIIRDLKQGGEAIKKWIEDEWINTMRSR